MATQIPFLYDYYYLWAAGQLVLQGRDPYDLQLFSSTMYQIGWPQDEGVWGFTHPPWIFWIYTPFSLASFEIARFLWIGFLSLLVFVLFRLSQSLSQASKSFCGSLPPALCFFAILCYPPTIKILAYGQVSFVMAIGLLAALLFFQRKKEFLAGLALSLTLIKPHLLVAFYVAFYLHCLLSKHWRIFLGTALGFIIQALIGVIIYPSGFSDYLHYVPQLINNSPLLPGTSLVQIAVFHLGMVNLQIPALVLSVAIGAYIGISKNFDLSKVIHILLPCSLLLAPYSFSHEMILLLPTYLLLISIIFNRFSFKVTGRVCFLLGILGVIIVAFIRFEFLTVVIPITLLVVTKMFESTDEVKIRDRAG